MAVVLVIAGIDPSGGAGLLADVALVRARMHHPAGVATALTVQDSRGCLASHPVAPSIVGRQLALLVEDAQPAAVKIGMLGDERVAQVVAEALAPLAATGVPIVLDPVLRASVGVPLLDGDPAKALAPLLEMATLVTPNRVEAEWLARALVVDAQGQREAARAIRARGVRAALVKGGHLPGPDVEDLLDDGEEPPLRLRGPRVPGETPRGTGCALATEIACLLADGRPLREAVTVGRERLAGRIAGAVRVGRGRRVLGPP
jgi:hydroxymethylpyrimidine/phosphomethylpyrimidine kinase